MFDLELFQFIHGFANRSAVIDWFGIFIAEYAPYIVGLILIILWVRIRSWHERMRLLIVFSFSLILARGLIFEVIRYWYSRPRPFVSLGFTPLFLENSYAFPSSHAIVLVIIGCVAYLISKKWGIGLIAFAVINALFRIFCGVHWPTDSIAGIVIAIISILIATRMFPRTTQNTTREESVEQEKLI